MYTLFYFYNSHPNNDILLSNLLLSLSDNTDYASAANALNLRLCEYITANPAEKTYILYEIFRTVMRLYKKELQGAKNSADKGNVKQKYKDVCTNLFSGISYPSFERFAEILELFADIRYTQASVELWNKLYELSNIDNRLISYMIKRSLMNMLITTGAFVNQIELTKKATADLKQFSNDEVATFDKFDSIFNMGIGYDGAN